MALQNQSKNFVMVKYNLILLILILCPENVNDLQLGVLRRRSDGDRLGLFRRELRDAEVGLGSSQGP